MLNSIKKREDQEKSEVLASLQKQVKVYRLQHELCKQNFHEDIKKYLNLSLNILKMSLRR